LPTTTTLPFTTTTTRPPQVITVTADADLLAYSVTPSNVTCSVGDTIDVAVDATGGAVVMWSTGPETPTVPPLAPRVTDSTTNESLACTRWGVDLLEFTISGVIPDYYAEIAQAKATGEQMLLPPISDAQADAIVRRINAEHPIEVQVEVYVPST
jgi:hypothetical protein